MPKVFVCPEDGRYKKMMTSYLTVVGQQTPFPGTSSRSLNRIPDGTSSTILVVEVADSGIQWMDPRDLDFEKMSFQIGDETQIAIRSKQI